MKSRTMKSRVRQLALVAALLLPGSLMAQQEAGPMPDDPVKTQPAPGAGTDDADEVLPNGNLRIRGIVSDEQGESIIGATIIVKGQPEMWTDASRWRCRHGRTLKCLSSATTRRPSVYTAA